MSDIQSVIEKVKKLLALTKSSNANEAAAAANQANRLIDAHRLSQADLEATDAVVTEPIESDSDYIYQSGRVNAWKTTLVAYLVKHYGLAHWNDVTKATGRQVSRYRLVGRRSDIEICKYMFAWLSAECGRLADIEAKGKGRVYVGSYCLGFVAGIAEQLKLSRTDAKSEASSSAIVKIDARTKESQDWMHKSFELTKSKYHSQSQVDGDAYGRGEKQGKNLHIGSSLNSGGKLLNR